MKLKYKKLIVLVSIGTMFLSFVILSMVPTGGDIYVTPKAMELKKVEDPKIIELIHAYYKAKAEVDFDTAEDLVSDVTQIPVKEWQMRKEVILVQEYQNIVCYSIENEKLNAYLIFVQYDIKFVGIDTLAPSFTSVYVKLGSDDKYMIYLNALDEEEDAFIQSANENEDVQKLKEDTTKQSEEAIESDPKLKESCQQMMSAIASMDESKETPAVQSTPTTNEGE